MQLVILLPSRKINEDLFQWQDVRKCEVLLGTAGTKKSYLHLLLQPKLVPGLGLELVLEQKLSLTPEANATKAADTDITFPHR